MKKTIILISILLATATVHAQKNCFSHDGFPSIEDYPDSIDMEKKLNMLVTDVDAYFDNMVNCDMPEINLVTINGDSVTNESLKGKVVVVNFWFIECKSCIEEIPFLDSLQKHFYNNDVVFLGICSNSKDKICDFLKNVNFSFQMISGNEDIAYKFLNNYWPHTYIFDKENKLKARYSYISDKKMLKEIENKIFELL